jgi:hypothetical protein
MILVLVALCTFYGLIGMGSKFTYSTYRFYLFLFFTAAYTFLTFWIGATLFYALPFAIGGLAFYVFVVLFHKGIVGIVERNEEKFPKKAPVGMFVGLIIFVSIYILGVWFMQGLVVKYGGVSSSLFIVVGSVLELISIGISILLSFFRKH